MPLRVPDLHWSAGISPAPELQARITVQPDMPGMPGANRPSAAAAPGGGFFRRETWPVYTNYQGDIDLIGNRKVPSYYQYVVWRKSKVEMFVHRPIPEGKREVTSRWGFPDELKSWNWRVMKVKNFRYMFTPAVSRSNLS